MLKTTPCNGCGNPIVWGKTGEGKFIPLDPRPPVYMARQYNDEIFCDRIEPTRLEEYSGSPEGTAMVSHFATCHASNQFSRSTKKKETAT